MSSDVMQENNFALNLVQADPQTGKLQIWQSGTIAWVIGAQTPPVQGTIRLPGYYKTDITFEGTTSQTTAGTILIASGGSNEVQVDFTIAYKTDGFLFTGSYLGGLMNLLDFSAQETYLYIMEGLSPQ